MVIHFYYFSSKRKIGLNNILFEYKNMNNPYIYIQDMLGFERKPMAYRVHFLVISKESLWVLVRTASVRWF